MTARIEKNKLIIEIEFNEQGTISKSGSSRVHASTRGNQPSNVQVNGKTLVIGLNAYTPNH
jgi:hypothetical protein